MDYANLAQLSAPGQSPLTSGVVDAVGYQLWLNKANMQQEALRNMVPLADQAAQVEQQKTKEYMAGAAGREDTIRLGNMNAAANLQGFDSAQELKTLEEAAKKKKFQEQLSGFATELAEGGDAFVNAKDEAERASIVAQYKGKEITGPNGQKYVVGTDPQKDVALFGLVGYARKHDPKLQVKRDVEGIKGVNKLDQIDAKGAVDLEIAKYKGAVAKQIADAKAAQAAGKQLNLSQKEALMIEQLYPDPWDQAKYFFAKAQASVGAQKLEQSAGAANSVLSGQGVRVPPPQVIEPPVPSTPPAPKKQQFEVGKIYKDAKGNKAKYTEKGWEPIKE